MAGVDALAIGSSLYADAPLRAAVVASATNDALCESGGTLEETRECVRTTLDGLGANHELPVGWTEATTPDDVGAWALKAAGIGLTAFAVTFGAPFWFDALNKLGSLRNTGAKPGTRAAAS